MAKGFVFHLLLVGLGLFFIFVPVLQAQTPRSHLRWPEPVRMPLGLADITNKAGMIFSGRVLSISPCRSAHPPIRKPSASPSR